MEIIYNISGNELFYKCFISTLLTLLYIEDSIICNHKRTCNVLFIIQYPEEREKSEI